VLVAIAAVVYALARAPSASTAVTAPAPLPERHVAASDVIKLLDGIEVVVDAGQPRGIRPKDAALARALDLADDDVIVSISGRTTTRERDVTDILTRISMVEVRSLFVELEGADRTRHVVRWLLDGDLFDARRDAQAAAPGAGPAAASLHDPLDSIEKLDDTHYRISRRLLLVVLAAPAPYLATAKIDRGARGFVLRDVRPDSLFARLGAVAGDTIVAFNGEPVLDIDDVASWFNNARRGTSLTVGLVRSDSTPVTIHIAIR